MNKAQQSKESAQKSDSKLVYVVDDERMVGDIVQMILRMDGYEPVLFDDPEAALRSFNEAQTKPTLLLTDFTMTPINGLELIQRCRQQHPDLKTILYSGNTREDILRPDSATPDAFLRKPFLPKNLLALVHSLAGRPSSRP